MKIKDNISQSSDEEEMKASRFSLEGKEARNSNSAEDHTLPINHEMVIQKTRSQVVKSNADATHSLKIQYAHTSQTVSTQDCSSKTVTNSTTSLKKKSKVSTHPRITNTLTKA